MFLFCELFRSNSVLTVILVQVEHVVPSVSNTYTTIDLVDTDVHLAHINTTVGPQW